MAHVTLVCLMAFLALTSTSVALRLAKKDKVPFPLPPDALTQDNLGGIQYYQYSKGKYCDVGDDYVYAGNDIDCRTKCIQTIGCNYWTNYSSGFCQLSATCEKESLADDPSSRTFAQVDKEDTFSQYSVGTRCTSDKGFLLDDHNVDCAQQCKLMKQCFYYTVDGSGRCQLSKTCTEQEQDDPSAVTYQAPSALDPNSAVPKAGTKMCSNGKLLPNLYLLGVQKAGTTSLAGDLVEGGVWNVRLDDAAMVQESNQTNDGKSAPDAASYGALVSAAGTMAGDLMSTGVLKPQDLSTRTKQAIADDLVTAGVLSDQTVDHLDDDTKKSLAADFLRTGVLNKLRTSVMDNKTQTLLTRDLVQACFINESISQSMDQASRQDLARDLVRASVSANVFANFPIDKLRNSTKQMLAVDFVQAGVLQAGFIDRLGVTTKMCLIRDALENNLLDQNAVVSLSTGTKQFIASDVIGSGSLNGDISRDLANNTKRAIAADFVSAGRLEMAVSSSMQPTTQAWLAFDINRIRAEKGWNIIMQDELSGKTLAENLQGLQPEQLSNQTKVFLGDDLAHSADLFNKDAPLSDATKQMITNDLILAGGWSDFTDLLASKTKLSLADDLLHSGLLQNNVINQMDDQTKQLLADDFISAGVLKGAANFTPANLDGATKESLAGDLVRAGLMYDRLAPATDLYLAWDVVKAGLLSDEIADKLSTDTKQSIVGKLQSNGLFNSDLADHLDSSTKASLGGELVRQANFLDISKKAQSLQESTKLSITNNLISSGIMQRSATMWRKPTKELLVDDIMNAGLQNYTKKYTKGFMDVTMKESHYFEHAVLAGYNYSSSMLEGAPTNWTASRLAWKDYWLSNLMDCPKGDAKPVYADFTPANMRMVPLPDGTKAEGRQWGILGDAMFNVNRTVPSDLVMDLPQLMDDFYGKDKNKVTFVVMLREPMSRMQSAYYHAKNSPGSGPCVECKGASFKNAMNKTLMYAYGKAKGITRPVYRDWLWTSMYARQLEHWFQHFHPSQFYVIPTFIYSKGSNTQICKDLSARVKTDIDCMPFKKTIAAQRNTHEHQPVEEDSSLGLRMHFYDIMNPENDRLIKVLSEGQKKGLSLATYEGKRGDEAQIKQWLVTNW